MKILNLSRVAAVAGLSLAAPAGWAAAPDTLEEPATAAPAEIGLGPSIDYSLDREMVVKNWVLCLSQPLAEQLARAREAGPESARLAYLDLASRAGLFVGGRRGLRRARVWRGCQSVGRLGVGIRRIRQPRRLSRIANDLWRREARVEAFCRRIPDVSAQAIFYGTSPLVEGLTTRLGVRAAPTEDS
jgi:hypothetical protein